MKVLSKQQALRAMELGKQYHEGVIELPPEIVILKVEIDNKKRNAILFMALLREVDMGMVTEVVDMMLHLDALYCQWVERETPTIH